MAKNNVADLDTTAANNTDFAGTDSTGTTGLVKNGDNILRTIGAMLKKWWNDLGGTATVGGTANAITLTSASTYQSLVSGIRILFKPGADNSGATTINLDSLGVKAVRKISGGSDVALAGGEILNGQRADVVYDSTANSSAGAWILINGASTTAYQPLDSDLTTIAGLTATTDNFMQAKAGAWASRTPTQATADLIAVVGDSGSGGTKGLVPAPSSGDAAAGKYLKADGTWATVSTGQPIPSSSTLAVGTMLVCAYIGSTTVTDGSTTAGTNLARLSGSTTSAGASGGALTGTWKNINGASITRGDSTPQIGLWVRTV